MRRTQIADEGKMMRRNLELSPRQKQVLKLLCQGKTMKQVSKELRLSLPTVMTHVRRSYVKMGTANRVSAVLAFMNGEAGEPQWRHESSNKMLLENGAQKPEIALYPATKFRFCPACGRDLALKRLV